MGTGEVVKKKKSKKSDATALLSDDRFKEMFSDERFEVDTTEEAYKLLNPVISKLDDSKKRKLEKQFLEVASNQDNDIDNLSSGDENGTNSDLGDSNESSDDEKGTQEWTQKVREQHKQLRVDTAIEKRTKKDQKL